MIAVRDILPYGDPPGTLAVICSRPIARVDAQTPTVRATRTIPAVWPLADAVAMAAALQERDQAMAEVARLAARVAVLEAGDGR